MRQALVLVKSWQTATAAGQLAASLAEDGVALTLQNGAGNREKLVDALGAERVALGVTTTGATLLEPGCVRPAGEGVVSLGMHSRLGPLADRLRAAGFVVEDAPDPDALLWGKLVINAAINPLTALLGVPNGALLERPPARSLLAEAAREAAAVAAAQGLRLPFDDPVGAAERVAQRTAANRSSMLQDVQRGAPTEIDAICGAIVTAGEQAGVQTPVNRILWQLVKAQEEGIGARRPIDY
jgi:2-dehydropantoate 2-reductase